MSNQHTVLIIGGGIIGGSIAFALAKRGIQSTIIEKGTCSEEASSAAAGMLGAHVETHQSGAFFDLCKASLSIYPHWIDEIYERSRISAQLIDKGILRVAMTEEDEQELKSRLPWIGPEYDWLSAEDIREIEPKISDRIRGGIYFHKDYQVHAAELTKSLFTAIRKMGCTIIEQTEVLEILRHGDRVTGVKTTKGDFHAEHTVLAAGAWSGRFIPSLGDGKALSVFPVKGQCLSLRAKTAFTTHTIFTKGCYVVPKMDGSVIVGATQVQSGFDKQVSDEDTKSLYNQAIQLVPELDGADITSVWAGLRPGTPDGLPYIGSVDGISGLTIATGHFRNGILLAPITGKICSELIIDGKSSIEIGPFSPNR